MYPNVYPNSSGNSIIIVFILLLMCCCCYFFIYCGGIILYIYYYNSVPDGYKKYTAACIPGLGTPAENTFTNKSISECAELCDQRNGCVAFQIYKDHGGSRDTSSGDCQLSFDSIETTGCDGTDWNFDLYIKETR